MVPLSYVLANAASKLETRPTRFQMAITGLSDETPSERLQLAGRTLALPFPVLFDQGPGQVTAVLSRVAVVEDAQGWRAAIRFDRLVVDPSRLTWVAMDPDPRHRARRTAASRGRQKAQTRRRRVSEASIAAGWDSPD